MKTTGEFLMNFGMYKGHRLSEIPLDYFFWLFPKVERAMFERRIFYNANYQIYVAILDYFLESGVRVENRTNTGDGFCFFWKRYQKLAPDGRELPFFQSFWRGRNSEGKWVYELNFKTLHTFIEERKKGSFRREDRYISAKYHHGGLTMVYEKNSDYYFFDGRGRIYKDAFLMRKPYVDHRSLDVDFSKNFHTTEMLENSNRKHLNI